jgi:GNAT superfamily N-acetyltransferase
MSQDTLTTRTATDADLPAILRLLGASMGRVDDERFEELFRWKHIDNAFGPSPMWVACDGTDIVGLRTLMRWEFERAGRVFRCVRAVDTATHPDYQGRGIFSGLTRAALPALDADGVDFVFNTPNSQSLPGYLKMGWREIGRAPTRVRPLSPRGAVGLFRNRVPASHWSEPPDFGVPVTEAIDDIVRHAQPAERLQTRCTRGFLQWRYEMPLLAYRVVPAAGGGAILRIRRRGTAREAVVAALFASDALARRDVMRAVRRAVAGHADHLIALGTVPDSLPISSLGPIVTTRDLASTAPTSISDFDLSLGDIELF